MNIFFENLSYLLIDA